MKKITVVTGNNKKLWQAQTVFEPMGITADGEDAVIHEIQSPDGDIHGVEIAREKARAAFSVLARPLIVCDQYWEIPALGGFPGPYMKDIDKYLKAEDILAMMVGKDNRIINLYENVVYTDGAVTKDFTAVYPLPGYRKPEDFHPYLVFFGGNHHKKGQNSYAEFMKTYRSPYVTVSNSEAPKN